MEHHGVFKLRKRIYQAVHSTVWMTKHHTTEELDEVKVSSPVLKPSRGSDSFA